MYLAAILDSSRKGGNLLLFLINYGSNQSVSIVESCQITPPQHWSDTNPNAPKYPQMKFTDFNYESSYLPGLTRNMDFRVILAGQLADQPPQ